MAKLAGCKTTVTAVALIAGVSSAAPSVSHASDAVVRVYDSSTGHSKTRAAAIRTAASIVAEAGLDIDWTDCSRASRAGACTDLRGPNDLVVRIMPVGTSGPPGLLVRNQMQTPLGFSVVDPVVSAGAIALVFLDRVLGLAHRTRVDPGRLLGRTVAHEIGHLVLGTTTHSRSGIMRGVWTDEEISRNHPQDWVFTDRLRSRIR